MIKKKKNEGFYKKGPFQEIGSYRFRRAIFRYMFGLMVLLFVFALADAGYTLEPQLYFKCPEDARGGYCDNPFFKECLHYPSRCPFAVDYPELPAEFEVISDQDKLPAGFSIGEPVPFFVKNFGAFVGILIVLALGLNHFLYNKGYDFKKKGKQLVKEMNEEV